MLASNQLTGIEFDLAYYPIDALRLTLAGTFLDPKSMTLLKMRLYPKAVPLMRLLRRVRR